MRKVYTKGIASLVVVVGLAIFQASCRNIASEVKDTSSPSSGSLVSSLESLNLPAPNRSGEKLSYEAGRMLATRLDMSAIQSAIKRYMVVTGKIPESYQTLEDEGYLFFKPLIKPEKWHVGKDSISASISVHSGLSNDPTDFETEEFTFYHPNSERELERRRKGAEYDWQTLQSVLRGEGMSGRFSLAPPDSPWRKLTKEDFISGRVSLLELDKLRGYSADEKEFAQILWARELAQLLSTYAVLYNPIYKRYPKTSQELLDFIGERIPSGWIAPLTGKPVEIGDEFTGSNVAYIGSENGRRFEVIVPLFGAGGSRQPIDVMRLSPKSSGFYAGKYYRIVADKDHIAESTPISYGFH